MLVEGAKCQCNALICPCKKTRRVFLHDQNPHPATTSAKDVWVVRGINDPAIRISGSSTSRTFEGDPNTPEINNQFRLSTPKLIMTMPKSLDKARKHISKKKGNITALHENSRDSQKLRRALMRDDKLVRVASSRRKNDQPLSTNYVNLQ